MKVELVTFATPSMMRSADLCLSSAYHYGVRGSRLIVGDSDDEATRGAGFWRWKPEIILRAMNGSHLGPPMEDGGYLIYSDAGVEFINNVNYIIDRMDQDIFLFGNNWEHAHWCKRDTVEKVWPLDLDRLKADPRSDDESVTFGEWWESAGWERFGKQVQASVIFFRVSDYTRKFVKEWLDWCLFEGGRLIDDSPSRTPNHPEFREHRHDQAILSTMSYREGLKLHYWPAVYNRGGSPEFVYEKLPEYASDEYPTLFWHHRRRDHEWPEGARWIGSTPDGEQFKCA